MYFSVYFEGNYDVIMTSDYVTVSIQFSPKYENDEYVVVCSIFGPGMSGFRVINSKAFSPVTGSKKKKTKNRSG